MSRPLRIEYPGACYHIMNRGNQRMDVFSSAGDYKLFLDKLIYYAEIYQIEIFSYCLMSNHFHIYLKTHSPNLGRFMKNFLIAFTISLNNRNKKCGHLFQGRYKAQLVESELYSSELSRYIHLNPIRTNNIKNLSIEQKRNYLKNYQWSSYSFCIGQKECPNWLNSLQILSGWGDCIDIQMKSYRTFVEEGFLEDIKNPFDSIVAQSLLGSESFVEKIKRKYLLFKKTISREEVSLLHLQSSFTPEEIVSIIGHLFEVSAENILRRRSVNRIARKVAMYSCSKYCCYTNTLTEIADYFHVSVSGLTRARDRFDLELNNNIELQKLLKDIKNELLQSQ